MGSENIFSGLSIPELHLLIAQSPNPETSEAASLELIELMKNNGDIFALIKIAEDARRSENIREAAKAVLIPTGELAIKNFTEKGNLARLLKLKSHKNAPIEIRKAADIALFPAGLIAIGKHQLAKDEENLSKIMNDERLPDGVRKAAFTAIENIELELLTKAEKENNIQTVFHLKKKGVGEKVRTAAEHASESLGMKRVRNLEEHVSSNAINELSIIASDIDYPDSVRTEALAAIRRLDQRIKEEQTPNVRKLIEIVRTAESFETRAAALQKIADMPNKCQYSNLSSPDAELLNKIAKTQGTPIKYRINAAQIIISLYERRGELYRLREMHYNEEYPKKTRDQAKEAIERMQFSQIESHDKKNALSELLRLAEAGFTDAVKEKAGLSLVEIHTKKEDVKRLDALISNPSCMPSVVEAAKVAKSRIVSALEIRFHAGRARRDGEFQKWLPPKDRTILAGGGAHQRFRKPTLVKL